MTQETDAPSATTPGGHHTDHRRATRPRRRGVGFWAGLMLVLAGLGMLGYVGWQFYGTNYVSRQNQQRVIEKITDDWSVAPATKVEGPTETRVAVGEPMGLIRIPAFGDDYVVPLVEGVTDEVLASGFGHFPPNALPGGVGNFAIAAHRVTHGEPLRDMPQLRPGDEVIVETERAVYTYELTTNPNDLIVTFRDVWVVDPLPSNPDGGVEPPSQKPGQRLLTLTTCAELFHTDDRMIAFGRLVDTEAKRASKAG